MSIIFLYVRFYMLYSAERAHQKSGRMLNNLYTRYCSDVLIWPGGTAHAIHPAATSPAGEDV